MEWKDVAGGQIFGRIKKLIKNVNNKIFFCI